MEVRVRGVATRGEETSVETEARRERLGVVSVANDISGSTLEETRRRTRGISSRSRAARGLRLVRMYIPSSSLATLSSEAPRRLPKCGTLIRPTEPTTLAQTPCTAAASDVGKASTTLASASAHAPKVANTEEAMDVVKFAAPSTPSRAPITTLFAIQTKPSTGTRAITSVTCAAAVAPLSRTPPTVTSPSTIASTTLTKAYTIAPASATIAPFTVLNITETTREYNSARTTPVTLATAPVVAANAPRYTAVATVPTTPLLFCTPSATPSVDAFSAVITASPTADGTLETPVTSTLIAASAPEASAVKTAATAATAALPNANTVAPIALKALAAECAAFPKIPSRFSIPSAAPSAAALSAVMMVSPIIDTACAPPDATALATTVRPEPIASKPLLAPDVIPLKACTKPSAAACTPVAKASPTIDAAHEAPDAKALANASAPRHTDSNTVSMPVTMVCKVLRTTDRMDSNALPAPDVIT